MRYIRALALWAAAHVLPTGMLPVVRVVVVLPCPLSLSLSVVVDPFPSLPVSARGHPHSAPLSARRRCRPWRPPLPKRRHCTKRILERERPAASAAHMGKPLPRQSSAAAPAATTTRRHRRRQRTPRPPRPPNAHSWAACPRSPSCSASTVLARCSASLGSTTSPPPRRSPMATRTLHTPGSRCPCILCVSRLCLENQPPPPQLHLNGPSSNL